MTVPGEQEEVRRVPGGCGMLLPGQQTLLLGRGGRPWPGTGCAVRDYGAGPLRGQTRELNLVVVGKMSGKGSAGAGPGWLAKLHGWLWRSLPIQSVI